MLKRFNEELERYLSRGFPEEAALCKAIAHTFTPGVPGVWRVVENLLLKEEMKRMLVIDSVPERFRDAVKELLACTRLIETSDGNGIVSWGWFHVKKIESSDNTATYELVSDNSDIPTIHGVEYKKKFDEYGFTAVIKVQKGELGVLRTSQRCYEIVGLVTYARVVLLEVRCSERGIKAIKQVEKIVIKRGG